LVKLKPDCSIGDINLAIVPKVNHKASIGVVASCLDCHLLFLSQIDVSKLKIALNNDVTKFRLFFHMEVFENQTNRIKHNKIKQNKLSLLIIIFILNKIGKSYILYYASSQKPFRI